MIALAHRSRHYSPELRAEFNALDWRDAAERAAGWRRNAADTDLGPEWVAHSLVVAAWLQSISDRNRPPGNRHHPRRRDLLRVPPRAVHRQRWPLRARLPRWHVRRLPLQGQLLHPRLHL